MTDPQERDYEQVQTQALVQIATDLHRLADAMDRIAIDLGVAVEFCKPAQDRKSIEEIFETRDYLLSRVAETLSRAGIERFLAVAEQIEFKGPGEDHEDRARAGGRFAKEGE